MSYKDLIIPVLIAKKIYQSSKKKKKKRQLIIDTKSGDLKIANIITQILEIEKKIKKCNIENNESKLEYNKLKEPEFEKIEVPVKDEFETTEQFNKRIQKFNIETENSKIKYEEEMKKFKIKKQDLLNSYTNDRNALIKELDITKCILQKQRDEILKEKIRVNIDSRIFPDISLRTYDADKEFFIMFVGKHDVTMNIPIDKAKKFKDEFDNMKKEFILQIISVKNQLFYKFLELIIIHNSDHIHYNIPDYNYKLPISSFKKVSEQI